MHLGLLRTQDKAIAGPFQALIHGNNGLEDWGSGGAPGDPQTLHHFPKGQLSMVQCLCEGALHILQHGAKAGAIAWQPRPQRQHVDEVAHQPLQLWQVSSIVWHSYDYVFLAAPARQHNLGKTLSIMRGSTIVRHDADLW